MKTETITYKSLKQLLKFSIAINLELGFYLAWHQRTLTIDKSNNRDPNKIMLYKICDTDRDAIFILLNAYAKLHMRKLSLE